MSPDQMVKDGNIEISETVLMTYVEKTVEEFEGISLSKRRKAVKITKAEDSSSIDIALDVSYGTVIPDTVKELQAAVKERIIKLAGVNVSKVNVVVEGLNLDELIKK